MKSIVISFAFIGIILAQVGNTTDYLEIGQFECEGMDGSNYTYITQWSLDEFCSNFTLKGNKYLIRCQQNGQPIVNLLSVLAYSPLSVGAYYQFESLYLATSGNLEGKYLYLKEIGLKDAYLKKCSSVLGYSYKLTKSQILLIADKLDPNVLISPTGAFEPFKKSATTICKGIGSIQV